MLLVKYCFFTKEYYFFEQSNALLNDSNPVSPMKNIFFFCWLLFSSSHLFKSQIRSSFIFTKRKCFTEFERTIVNKLHYDINTQRQSSVVPLQIHHSNCCGNKRAALSLSLQLQCFKTATWGHQFKHGLIRMWYKYVWF